MLIHSASMWSQFSTKYKRGRAELSIDGDATNAAGIAPPHISSFIAKQSASAASAFLSAPQKKRGIKREGGLSPVGSSSSLTSSSDSDSLQVPKPVKNERSALSILQDVLLGRD